MARKPAPADSEKKNRSRTRPLAAAMHLRRTKSEREWLAVALRQAEEMYAEARAAESYVAAEKCLRSAQAMRAQLGVLEAAELQAKGPESEEEFLAAFDDRLRALPTPYLERAVQEYLRRHPGVQLVAAT